MFKKEQKVYNIGGITIGGQIGENPPVLIGSIFYDGHKIVKDAMKGKFDEAKAEKLIRRADELTDAVGCPTMLDVVASSSKAMLNYIDFVSDVTESPILIDSADPEALLAGVKHADKVGLHERVVYNSINWRTKQEEIDGLKESKVKAAVVFAFNENNPTIQGKLEVLKGSNKKKGLIDLAKEAGIEKILIDTAAIDVPDVGPSMKAAYLIKSEYGYPSGCSSSLVVDMWKKGKELDPKIYKSAYTAALAFPAALGANFIFYGPIGLAPRVYHACGLLSSFVAYAMRQYGVTPSKTHPLRKIF